MDNNLNLLTHLTVSVFQCENDILHRFSINFIFLNKFFIKLNTTFATRKALGEHGTPPRHHSFLPLLFPALDHGVRNLEQRYYT